MSESEKQKVIVVVGQTASGKTSLAIRLAQDFGGEVVSADSRQVYRGLDLGSGKVTVAEMQGIPHHLLDVVNPQEVYTVADYVRDGRRAVADIHARDKLPIIAGGTFLYVDALLGEVSMPEVPPNPPLRAEFEIKTTADLYNELTVKDPDRAATIDPHNRRRLIRALEIVDALGSVPVPETESHYDVLKIGISIPSDELHKNIHTRLVERIDSGMIDEVQGLLRDDVTNERLEELGLEYRYIGRYLAGELDKETMLHELEVKIRQFAKRQLTWLKRDKNITWYSPGQYEDITAAVTNFLSTPYNLNR